MCFFWQGKYLLDSITWNRWAIIRFNEKEIEIFRVKHCLDFTISSQRIKIHAWKTYHTQRYKALKHCLNLCNSFLISGYCQIVRLWMVGVLSPLNEIYSMWNSTLPVTLSIDRWLIQLKNWYLGIWNSCLRIIYWR